MPHQRKARTRSTESFHSTRSQRRLQLIRAQVAAEAARIIATEGLHDFHAAKRKASERIGINERLALPSNLEVQDALISYLNLYGGQQHQNNLLRLRLAALEAMRMLRVYSPRLTGPVLDGSAGPHSRVTLHVFCDAAETLVFDFLERGLLFRQEQRRMRLSDKDYQLVPIFLIEVGGCTVELLVLDSIAVRQAPPSPIDGKPLQRASLSDLERMLDSNSTAA